MGKLIESRYTVRRNLVAMIGLCLSLYFSYHTALGERSFVRLKLLEHKISALEKKNDLLQQKRTVLEGRVVKLRPGSIDPDLLEERAHIVLGYYHPGERVIISAR